MVTLHMNTEVASQTASQLRRAHNELSNIIEETSSTARSLESEWMGNSANQFQEQFSQWRQSILSIIESLDALVTALDQEIQEWEAADASL